MKEGNTNMNVKFYPKTVDYRCAKSAKFLFKGNSIGYEKGTFIRISEEGENVPFFLGEGILKNSIAMRMAQKLLEEKEANVVLMCRPNFFKEIIKYSRVDTEAHIKYDDQEKMLIYYVTIVDEKAVLLIAYEEWD